MLVFFVWTILKVGAPAEPPFWCTGQNQKQISWCILNLHLIPRMQKTFRLPSLPSCPSVFLLHFPPSDWLHSFHLCTSSTSLSFKKAVLSLKNGLRLHSPPITWKNPPLPYSAQESIPVVLPQLRGGLLEIGEQGATDSDQVWDDVLKSSRNEEVAN